MCNFELVSQCLAKDEENRFAKKIIATLTERSALLRSEKKGEFMCTVQVPGTVFMKRPFRGAVWHTMGQRPRVH